MDVLTNNKTSIPVADTITVDIDLINLNATVPLVSTPSPFHPSSVSSFPEPWQSLLHYHQILYRQHCSLSLGNLAADVTCILTEVVQPNHRLTCTYQRYIALRTSLIQGGSSKQSIHFIHFCYFQGLGLSCLVDRTLNAQAIAEWLATRSEEVSWLVNLNSSPAFARRPIVHGDFPSPPCRKRYFGSPVCMHDIRPGSPSADTGLGQSISTSSAVSNLYIGRMRFDMNTPLVSKSINTFLSQIYHIQLLLRAFDDQIGLNREKYPQRHLDTLLFCIALMIEVAACCRFHRHMITPSLDQ